MKRDYKAVSLPREGFKGRVPACPLPKPTAREREVWREVWRMPQAAAWVLEPWRWPSVVQYVRWSVRMESPTASASTGTVVIRVQDQIGLSPTGLLANGWQVAQAEVRKEAPLAPVPGPAATDYRARFRLVPGPSARERMRVDAEVELGD